ncbi:MAG: 2-oxo acid dehydrogenase subunit E2 [Clostridia bacterium]|nr:2-oxo acid dehydrogenase subunit E2 [Clostridia bacterium]
MFWKRKGARLLKTLSPYDRILCHVMTKRSDAHVYFTDIIDCAPLDEYIAKVEEEKGIHLTYLDLVNAAIVRIYAQKPALNRFVMNGRVFANNDIKIAMAVKKSMREEGGSTTIKVGFTGHEDIFEIRDRFQAEIWKNKGETEANSTDKLIETLMKLPNGLLRMIVGILKWLDRINALPQSLCDALPFHSSVFVTYLKSIGIRSIYHHIYDFGTIGMFVALGKEQWQPIVDRKTKEIRAAKVLELKVVADERLCDGLYHAQSMRMFRKILENPEQLNERLETVIQDID